MLNEFFVDNFKSLINVTFRPAEVNLLLGANNSGKTTLCLALHFLCRTAVFDLGHCVGSIAGGRNAITNFYLNKPVVDFCIKAAVSDANKGDYQFKYRLSIRVENGSMGPKQLSVETESLHVTGGPFSDTLLLEHSGGAARLLQEPSFLEGKASYSEITLPTDTTMLRNVYDFKLHGLSNMFKAYLIPWQYHTFHPEAMRGHEHTPNSNFLDYNGANLASIIFQLKTENERSYRSLLKHLQKIDPRIDLINFVQAGEDQIFMFFEDKNANRLSTGNASEGTLRYLALVYALTQYAGHLPVGPPLLMIEEPENGIYVGLLKELMELLGKNKNGPQVIFTSHSPYFIDLFDNRLDGLFVLKRGEHNSRLEQPDPEQIRKRLEDYPLGEQHFREMFQ